MTIWQGTRTFTYEDQIWFARQSGDWNPIHVDALAARRLLYGGLVVHGIHLICWAMDQVMRGLQSETRIAGLKINKFEKPLLVGEQASIELSQIEEGCLRINILCEYLLATVEITLKPKPVISTFPQSQNGFPPSMPNAPSVETIASASGVLPIDALSVEFSATYPNLYRALGGYRLAFLLATTRLVGMHFPGLHSLFGGLILSFEGIPERESGTTPRLIFQTQRFDYRFSMLTLAVNGSGVHGQLRAFLRPQPIAQQTVQELRKIVSGQEFAGQKVLILGGSRGLGEVAAKLVATGGGESIITYHQGQADAADIIANIQAAGGNAAACRFDVSGGPDQFIETLRGGDKLSGVLYFASPKIDLGRFGTFNADLFTRLSEFYVSAFCRALFAIMPYCRPGALIYYPSTAFLDTPGTGGVEYCAAKAAGEAAVRELVVLNKSFRFVIERLPRLLTDQTVSIYGTAPPDAAAILLAMLRAQLIKGI